jgi:hypothetical protein
MSRPSTRIHRPTTISRSSRRNSVREPVPNVIQGTPTTGCSRKCACRFC